MIALLKILFIFAGIIILLSRKWNLGLVLIIAAVIVGLLFGYPLLEIGRDILATAIAPLTLRIALAVVLIMTLSELLRSSGSLKTLITSLQDLVPNGRIVIASLPALVGLLPMVGGAMFSAPMVDEVGEQMGIDQESKTFINYWFRHIWEYVSPVYPSVMLSAAMLGLSVQQLARATWPLTITAIIGGIFFGLKNIPGRVQKNKPTNPNERSLRTLAESIWPIILVIILSLVLPVNEDFRLLLGLVITISLVLIFKHIPMSTLWTILRQRIPWATIVVVFGALIFRQVLEGSGAVAAVSVELTNFNIPVAIIAFVVPFIAGLLTGLSFAAFSIGFPVVLPLVAPGGGVIASHWVVWLMAGGFLGVMFSPLHLCLSLTRVYYHAEWGPIYKRIIPSALGVVLTAVIILLLA
ncbi:MAG: hypothetical protein DRI56_08110 [Chloroflexota bacterium]|nr:MAG: hypothetical protein DRI56_08110 [Chloroflexota bacterium]